MSKTKGQRQLAAALAAGHHRRSDLYAQALARQVAGFLPGPQFELRFAPPRRWRFDLAWPAELLAVEIEGGSFIGGRHTRSTGFRADAEKYLQAATMGWLVVRVLPEWIGTAGLRTSLQAIVARRKKSGAPSVGG